MNTQPDVQDIIKIIDDNYNKYKGSNEAVLHAAEDIIELFMTKSEPIAPIDKILTAEKYFESVYKNGSNKSASIYVSEAIETAESFSNLRVEQAKEEERKKIMKMAQRMSNGVDVVLLSDIENAYKESEIK